MLNSNKLFKYIAKVAKQNYKIINFIGYVFLISTSLYLLYLLIHFQSVAPQQNINIISKTIASVWAFLLAYILIFYSPVTRDLTRFSQGKILLLSRLARLLGIFYLLTIPFLINDTLEIAASDRDIYFREIKEQTIELKQFEELLTEAIDFSGINEPQIKIDYPEKLRERIIKILQNRQLKVIDNLNEKLQTKRNHLIKTTSKLIIGAILAGVCSILIWRWRSIVN